MSNPTPEKDNTGWFSFSTGSYYDTVSTSARWTRDHAASIAKTTANEATKQIHSVTDIVSDYYTSIATAFHQSLAQHNPHKPSSPLVAAVPQPTTTSKAYYPSNMTWLLDNPYSDIHGQLNNKRSQLRTVKSILNLVDRSPSTHHFNENSMRGRIFKAMTDSDTAKDPSTTVNSSENASRLAEGSILVLRDLILDESLELQESLRFWIERWERPLLSWFEAGPIVWCSKEGYNHQNIGHKVSQIQAVLARRCASIGELQNQLLRADWHYGVAKWGILGDGRQWAAVAGGDGVWDDNKHSTPSLFHSKTTSPPSSKSNLFPTSSHKSTTKSSMIFVRNVRGGQILTNYSSLAAWSVDTLRIVRDHLYRASDDKTQSLPYFENWPMERNYFQGGGDVAPKEDDELPIWASSTKNDKDGSTSIIITDLPLMAAEVSSLLTSMEEKINVVQRNRRLEKLKPPTRLRTQWMLFGIGIPMIGYVAYQLLREDGWNGMELGRHVLFKIATFWTEHVSEPVKSICAELFTGRGRDEITDLKARINAMESLRKMIRNWLDETYPNITESERQIMSNSMDISLIEKCKEERIKRPIYEIKDIVYMSLIEMQFIKKELLNAMSAIDELMDSNEMNFRLAAMVPAVLIVYVANKSVRFLKYALLKLGKSREEIYASIRSIVLDVERLLVMRDDPPSSPPSPMPSSHFSSTKAKNGLSTIKEPKHCMDSNDASLAPSPPKHETQPLNTTQRHSVVGAGQETSNTYNKNNTALNSDDLGMLMLLVHECRTIIWKNRKRFSRSMLNTISEDLAELAGERGAVSVKQQLT